MAADLPRAAWLDAGADHMNTNMKSPMTTNSAAGENGIGDNGFAGERPTRRCTALTLAACGLTLALGGCAVGPNYSKPDLAIEAAYKEAPPAGWKTAAPADALRRGAWWEIFGDATLNDLEKQVDVSNQSLKQAEAQYRQSAALVSGARASFWPTLSASLSATRSGRYGNSGGGIVSGGTVISGGSSTGNSGSSHPADAYQLPLAATWEPDLWGSVRRQVEESAANAQASAATLESTRLSLHAQLATTYFELRIADEQKRLLDDTVVAYERALKLTQNQYNVGVVARADVITAETQLKGAQVQAIDLDLSRTQYEHALAVLIGKMPADFSLPAQKLTLGPPAIPVDVPATLLERRPDVAVAERQAEAANAQIGVAKAAWFPTLTLAATGGYSEFGMVAAARGAESLLVGRATACRSPVRRRRAACAVGRGGRGLRRPGGELSPGRALSPCVPERRGSNSPRCASSNRKRPRRTKPSSRPNMRSRSRSTSTAPAR